MEVTLAVIADAANISRENKLNILGVFHAYNARQFPVTLSDFTLVLRLQAGPAERGEAKTLTVRLLDEDGNLIHELAANFTLPNEPDKPEFSTNVLLAMRGLQLNKPGQYAFHILVNGEERESIPLQVRQRELPSAAE